MPITLVRVTQQPGWLLAVDDAELESLTRQKLLLGDGYDLTTVFAPDVRAVTVSIANAAGTVVVPTTAAYQTRTVGEWLYRWFTADQAGPGTYTATWTGRTVAGTTVSASTLVFGSGGAGGYGIAGYGITGYGL